MFRLFDWVMRRIEAWEDWRDPEWSAIYDPYSDSINNPSQKQVERMREEYRAQHGLGQT